jgi:predicted MPP superfamily phosphohydrolase
MIWLKRVLNRPEGSLKWVTLILIVTSFQFIYIYVFFIEPNWIQIEKIRIVNPRIAKALENVRVVQLSDLEISGFGLKEISLIELIKKLRPDLILVTGDLIKEKQYLQTLLDILSLMEPKFRTYLILGNEDGSIADSKGSLSWDRARASFVDVKAIRLNLKNREDSYFWLVGASNREELMGLMKNIPQNEPVILMAHHPDMVKQAALAKIDLMLAGHTHGGQVNIPILRKLFPYAKRSAYIAGLYKVKDTLLYVNRGFASDKSIRFLSRPEITLFDFILEGNGRRPRILAQDKFP